MLTDKIYNLICKHIVSKETRGSLDITTTSKAIEEYFTPKLKWKQESERVWRGATPFMYTFTIYFHSDGYWQVVKSDNPKFEGTLEECKKECERIFMEMYLQTCNDEL